MGLAEKLGFHKNSGHDSHTYTRDPAILVDDINLNIDKNPSTNSGVLKNGKETNDSTDKSAHDIKPPAKKSLFSFFAKPTEPSKPVAVPLSEDVFSDQRARKKDADENYKNKKGKKSKSDGNENKPVDNLIRIKVWVRRNRNEVFRPAKFCDCLVEYFASANERNIYSAPSARFTTQAQLQLPQFHGRNTLDVDDDRALSVCSGYSNHFSVSGNSGYTSARNSANSMHRSGPSKAEAISVSIECILQVSLS